MSSIFSNTFLKRPPLLSEDAVFPMEKQYSARDAINAVATCPFSAVQRPSDCSRGPARSWRCQQVL